MYVSCNNEARSRNHCCREKAISILHFSECVCARGCVRACPGAWSCACARAHVAVLIQRATRMRHVVLSFVATLATQQFATLSYERRDFQKNVTEHKMCVLIFSTAFLILRRIH